MLLSQWKKLTTIATALMALFFLLFFCEDVDIVLKGGMIAVGVHIFRNVRMIAPQTVQESISIQFRC